MLGRIRAFAFFLILSAVIRDLATTGKTLMIVTHEMNFARAICNRVFYMDEGGIYEDGSPDQIFDHPLKENTRRFVRRLKVLELIIDRKDYDFLGTAGIIEQYCYKNQISFKTAHRILLAFEELVHHILLTRPSNPEIRVVIEYSETEEKAIMTVRYSEEAWNATKDGDDLPLRVLHAAAGDISWRYQDGCNEVILRIQ